MVQPYRNSSGEARPLFLEFPLLRDKFKSIASLSTIKNNHIFVSKEFRQVDFLKNYQNRNRCSRNIFRSTQHRNTFLARAPLHGLHYSILSLLFPQSALGFNTLKSVRWIRPRVVYVPPIIAQSDVTYSYHFRRFARRILTLMGLRSYVTRMSGTSLSSYRKSWLCWRIWYRLTSLWA